MLPPKDRLQICFAHIVYQFRQQFLKLDTGIESFEVRDRSYLERRLPEADVLVVSSLHKGLLRVAQRLKFIQCIGAGTEQFDLTNPSGSAKYNDHDTW